MKIGFFTDTYLPHLNGVATSVYYFAKKLRENGNKVFIVAPSQRKYKDHEKDIFRITSIQAIPNAPESFRLPIVSLKKSWLKVFQLDYDIIHAHGNGLFSMLGLIIARQKRIPFLLTFHTLFDHYMHYFFKGKFLGPKHVNSFMVSFANRCDLVLTPSEKMKLQLKKLGVKKEIVVVPNFVEVERFRDAQKGFLHQKCNLGSEAKIVLSVGRLGKEKNFEFLIKAFAPVVLNCPDLHLVIVGEGPDLKFLKELTRKLKVSNNVHLTGPIQRELMNKVYADSYMFASASVTEVHPMVALEAAASALPLVLVNDPAFVGVIEDKVNGFIVPLVQKDFAEKIEFLFRHPKEAEIMGSSSRKMVNEHFSPEAIVAKLTKVYADMLSQRKRPKRDLVFLTKIRHLIADATFLNFNSKDDHFIIK